MHKLRSLGAYAVENFFLTMSFPAFGTGRYVRYTAAAAVKLREAGGAIAASLCEDGEGPTLVLSAFAADLATPKDAAAHTGKLIALLDVRAGTLAVREPQTPLGRAVLAWMLLRCIGMDATGVAPCDDALR